MPGPRPLSSASVAFPRIAPRRASQTRGYLFRGLIEMPPAHGSCRSLQPIYVSRKVPPSGADEHRHGAQMLQWPRGGAHTFFHRLVHAQYYAVSSRLRDFAPDDWLNWYSLRRESMWLADGQS